MLTPVTEFIRLYGSSVALGVTWALIGFVWLRRRRDWKHKQFLSRVNFSLNYLQDGCLAMRTLLELPAEEVWLNEHGCGLVLGASRKAVSEEPFIRLKGVKDQDFVCRAVLNALSQRYAEGYLAAALDLPVGRDQFLFGITCEKYGEIRTLKIRILLIRESTLAELFGPTRRVDTIDLPNPVVRARMQTLKRMYRHYLEDQDQTNKTLGHIELVLPRA